jgi:nucleoside-diphosphate-sugar epimerase
MTVYATGLSGTIGRALSRNIKPLKFSENGIDRSDLDLLRSGDVIIHLAAIVGESKVIENYELAHKINVLGTDNLAIQIAKLKDVRIIYISTGHVYVLSNQPRNEMHIANPQSLYARTKYEAENCVLNRFRELPEMALILRIFSIMDKNLDVRSLPAKIERLLTNRNVSEDSLIKFSDDVRDFLTLEEISSVIDFVSNRRISGILNVCSGSAITVREACIQFSHLLGYPNPESLLSFGEGNSELPFLVGDRSRLDLILGQ